MTTTDLIRWSGFACLVAGALYIVGALLHPVGEGLEAVKDTKWILSHLIYWVSVLLMHLGLVGLYVRQKEHSGWIGLVSFILAFFGTALVGSILLFVSTVMPLIADEAPGIFEAAMTPPDFIQLVFVLGFGLGWMLLGVVIMRVNVLPQWSGLLLVIGVMLFVISELESLNATTAHTLVTVGDVLFGSGLMWLGYRIGAEDMRQHKYRGFEA